jgi:peroxiredoxin
MFKHVLMSLFLMVSIAATAWGNVTTGQMAPDFTLTDTHGQQISLSHYKGNFVVLEWFNPECPFVKKHYNSHNIPDLQKKYTAEGVVWLSIDSSASGKQGNYSDADLNKFMTAKKGVPTAVLADRDGKVGHLFGAQTTPHIFIIGPKGDLIYQGAIDDTPSADIADLKTAKNYVSAALDAAMSGKPIAVNTTKSYGCAIKY